MEVLRSTDVLDKEIKADCNRRILEIMENAEKESSKILDSVNARVEEAVLNARQKSAESLKMFTENAVSLLPLKKQREVIAFVDKSVRSAIKDYIFSLPVEKCFTLFEEKALGFKKIIDSKKIKAFVSDFDVDKTKTFLEGIYENMLISVENQNNKDCDPFSIILKAEDDSVCLRLSVDECINEFIDKDSNLLAKTLFCGRIPE